MKKIFSCFLGFLLLVSLITPANAASNPTISIEGATTTIHLTKNNSEVAIDRIEFNNEEYVVQVGKPFHLSNISVRVYYTDGSSDYLSFDELTFTSANESVFTIDTSWLNGVAVGNASIHSEYMGYSFSANVSVVEKVNDVTFILPNIVDNSYVNAYRMSYLSDDRYNHLSIQHTYNPQTRELTIGGIDWSKEGPYIGYFTVANRLFKVEVNQEDKGKTINLPYDEKDYTAVTFDIPSLENQLRFSTIALTSFDANNRKITSGSFHRLDEKYNNTIYIPKGTYGIQVIAEESKTAYNLISDKLHFTKQTDAVTFNENDLAKITFDFKNLNQAHLSGGSLCEFTNLSSCYTMNLQNEIDSIVATKLDYSFFDYYIADGTNLVYEFTQPNLTLTKDQTIQIDNVFTTELKFNRPSYEGGARVHLSGYYDGTLKVTDKYGNQLDGIRHDNKRMYGTLTFTKGSEVYKVNVSNSLAHPSIVLPNAEGTFTVTYSLDVDDRVKPNVSGNWTSWPGTTRTVNPQYDWTITFNNTVNPSSLNQTNIFVVDHEGYRVEGVTLERSTDGKKVYVKAPSTNYKPGAYTLYINDNIKSTSNQNLSNKIKMPFTVK